MLGHRDAALEEAQRAEAIVQRTTTPPGRAHFMQYDAYCAIADVLAGAGDIEAARGLLEPLARASVASAWREGIAPTAHVLGACAELAGDLESAIHLNQRAVAAAGASFPGVAWRALAALARLSDMTGRNDESRRHGSEARSIIEQLAATLQDERLRVGFRTRALAQLGAPTD
jgi:hypothetical protein